MTDQSWARDNERDNEHGGHHRHDGDLNQAHAPHSGPDGHREDQDPEDVVDHRGAENHVGLSCRKEVPLAENLGSDPDRGGNQRRANEHRLDGARHPMKHDDQKETEEEREDDSEDGYLQGDAPNLPQVARLDLQADREDEEDDAEFG